MQISSLANLSELFKILSYANFVARQSKRIVRQGGMAENTTLTPPYHPAFGGGHLDLLVI
jgi:hypothetical protein